jgi:hypothetical protein
MPNGDADVVPLVVEDGDVELLPVVLPAPPEVLFPDVAFWASADIVPKLIAIITDAATATTTATPIKLTTLKDFFCIVLLARVIFI